MRAPFANARSPARIAHIIPRAREWRARVSDDESAARAARARVRASARVDARDDDDDDDDDVRWDVVRALCDDVNRAIAHGAPGERALKRCQKMKEVTNEERRAVAANALGGEVMRLRIAREMACAMSRSSDAARALERLNDIGERMTMAYWCAKRSGSERAGATPSDEALVAMYGKDVEAYIADVREENLTWSDEQSERYSMPSALARALAEELGAEDAAALSRAMNERGPVVCRANAARGVEKGEIVRMLRDEGAGNVVEAFANLSPGAFWMKDGAPAKGGIYGSRTWNDGYYEVQDEGSQLIVDAVEARPGDVVFDACAGNGGKTLALASSMLGRGKICAFDVNKSRLKHLLANAKRARVQDMIEVLDIDSVDELESESFDAVLVDAPCSSVGALRRSPSLRYSYDDPSALAQVQSSILESVSRLVKPGGRLVYATCSVLSVENQKVARSFETKHPEFSHWAFDAPIPTARRVQLLAHERLLLPHITGTDGFYMVRYKR